MPQNVEQDMQNHATISRAGEVDFPLWVKVLAWVIGIAIPIAILAGTWIAATIFDMSVRMARMEGQLQVANEDRYRESQAEAAHALIQSQIDENGVDIAELQGLHGRGGNYQRRSEQ
jgi:cell division septal protein FtsQ